MSENESQPAAKTSELNAVLERLTPADRDAIAAMPTGWFDALELPYPRIKRAEYRCDRLEKVGMLERRVTGSFPRFKTEYRLRSNAPAQAPAKAAHDAGEN